MIKTFIFVEDGSVDLDELKSNVGDDVLVIPYRQGSTPPTIQQPREPVARNSCVDQLKTENYSLRVQLIAITEFALEMCDEDGCAGDESVGLPSCEMWKDYEDERGCVYCECVLKRFLEKLKEENNDVES